MRKLVTIAYNKPVASRYDSTGEAAAVLGVLDSVEAVERSLLELGYHIDRLPLVSRLERSWENLDELNTDLVFNLFEGFCGCPESEALLPETLDKLEIPYTGCRADVLSLALDKKNLKSVLRTAGIPSPEYQVLTPRTIKDFQLDFPCIVKPCGEDASHGLTINSVVKNLNLLEKQVQVISESFGGRALVENFLSGREFNVTVMGKSLWTTLPVSELVYSLPPELPRILTFEAKWETGSPYFKGTNSVCPAVITPEEREHITSLALLVSQVTGCRGYARVDMRADEVGRINVMELNPNPDISPGAGVARQAAAAGMTYTGFIEKLIEIALEK